MDHEDKQETLDPQEDSQEETQEEAQDEQVEQTAPEEPAVDTEPAVDAEDAPAAEVSEDSAPEPTEDAAEEPAVDTEDAPAAEVSEDSAPEPTEDAAEEPVEEPEPKPEPPPAKRWEDIDFDNIEDMSEIYDMTIKNFEEGEVVLGTVVSIGADSVLVDIGFKSEGHVQLSEFPDPKSVCVDDEVDVLIEMVEDQDGMIVLSKTKADKIKNWAKIQTLFDENKLVQGKIVRKVKGGFKVDIGLDAFLPASQIARRPVGDLDQYLGQTHEFRIIKLTKRRRNVVLSRKQVLEEARSEEKAKLLESLEIGQELTGVIKNITDFGAFIDVGGIDGLLHITDMSWGRIKHPSEVASVGQTLTIKVLNFNKEEEKISLGYKQMSPNPWTSVGDNYPIGAVVRGKVVSMTDYGAFVQLEEGVEGMIHISEMSWTKRVRHPSEIVHIGQEIDIKLLNVDPKNEKISLGYKQIGENPWMKMKDKYPAGAIVPGLVRNLTDYGAFIQIEEGIDGLLHISDMSWTKKINHPSEVLKKGDEIEVQILNIDADHEKISLGIKQLESDPWREVGEKYRVGDCVETTISKLVSFGAFARLDSGIEGLIHISELSKDRVNKPEEIVKPGDAVTVKIISTDPATRKIGLSLKQYKEDTEKTEVDKYSGKSDAKDAPVERVMSATVGDVIAEQLQARAAMVEEARAKAEAEKAGQQDAAAESDAPTEEPDAAEVEDAPVEAEAPKAEETTPEAEAVEPEAAEEPEVVEAEDAPAEVEEPKAEETAPEAEEPEAAEAPEVVEAEEAPAEAEEPKAEETAPEAGAVEPEAADAPEAVEIEEPKTETEEPKPE